MFYISRDLILCGPDGGREMWSAGVVKVDLGYDGERFDNIDDALNEVMARNEQDAP